MKLKTVQVRNFRCVEDSEPFSVRDVTCLVGKNESGKTALLLALEKLNPVVDSRAHFTALDFPRRKWRPDEEIPKTPSAIATTWELEPEEVQELEGKFGKGFLQAQVSGGATQPPVIEAEKSYDNKLVVHVPVDEAALTTALVNGAGLSTPEKQALSFSGNTLAELNDAVAKVQPPTEEITRLRQAIAAVLPKGLETITETIRAMLPKFVYFGEYYKLDGTVSLPAFQDRKAKNQLTWGDRLFEALMHLAGTTAEGVSLLGTFEQLNAQLRAVSNQISDEIFTYWTQNKHLEAVLRFDHGRPSDPAPFNQGYVFRTRIDNQRHKSDTSFDERSSGFVWFFSFLVWFSQLKKQYGNRLVVLLDEPGLTLHARAQADLLRYFRERLKPNYQLIYTTHSPFMIDPDNILSARTVEDVVTKEGKILGTKVGEKVLSTDPDTVSPLQRALDYEVTQTLFVGRYNILVEGPSDLAYLKWFSNYLQTKGRTALDYRWTICIVGGVDRIPGFASLFRANGLRLAAVVDVAQGMKQKLQNAAAAIGQDRMLTLDKYAGQPEADIEDVLGREFYAALVNEAYQLRASDRFKPAAAKTRVAKDAETYFKTLPVHYAEFDHYAPAAWLFESGEAGAKQPGFDVAVNNMEKLIKDLNALL